MTELFFNFYKNFYFEDFLLICIIYNIIKYIIILIFNEIFWTTQYFNKKFQFFNNTNKNFIEILLKIKNTNNFFILFYQKFNFRKIV